MANEISVTFFTNLDEYAHEQWPGNLQCRPLIGDRISAKSRRSLKVVSVTHEFNGELRVELHR